MKMMSSFLLFLSSGEFDDDSEEEESALDRGGSSVMTVGAVGSVEEDIIW